MTNRSYSVHREELDDLTFDRARELTEECEKDAVEVAKKVGYIWKPTRALAWEAIRTSCDKLQEARDNARTAKIISFVSLLVSVATFTLLLVR